ncbi:Hypothetical protein LUCI_0808 [Lucifera butyrica]|uniref:Uncharacterized protein n=1 Tax=Lucifera butyrica TaxID=1351585 RepID=A0A498R8Y2_9FIRM|nr:hypothetical protein [Lucifera butyrica]VBB05598.1 Hypothetical protein LUCI_0808 [Lucifera butyrica]
MALPENKVVRLDELPLEKQVDALKKQMVAVLGDGQVFVKRTPTGAIKAVKSVVTLSEANGEIAVIQGKAMTTGKGFYRANQIANLSIITPEKLTLPTGQVVVNPFPVVDPESQTLRKVWVKKMAIGCGPTGNLVITTATLLYDINMYFIQDLMKKVTKNSGAGRICLETMLTEEEKKTGIFYKIDGNMGVWANTSHAEILKAIDTFINKKNFAERNAQTIAERLAMAKHPALSHIAYVNFQGPDYKRVAKEVIIGYVNDDNPNTLMDLAAKAERGEEITVNGQRVDIINVTAEASVDDIAVEADDEEKAATAHPEEGASQQPVLGGDLF